MFTTDADFNRLSSAIYRNRILPSQLKILASMIFAGLVCVEPAAIKITKFSALLI